MVQELPIQASANTLRASPAINIGEHQGQAVKMLHLQIVVNESHCPGSHMLIDV
jgi:hypothetical protein